ASALVSNSGHSNCEATMRLRHDRHSPAIARRTDVLPTPLSPTINLSSQTLDPFSFEVCPMVIRRSAPSDSAHQEQNQDNNQYRPDYARRDRTHTSDNPSGADHQ